MSDATNYTSNVTKMLQHLDRLGDFQRRRCWPVHVVFLPTTRCQLACSHCCFANRPRGEDLPWETFQRIAHLLSAGGTRGVEFTGGGDPTAWRDSTGLLLGSALMLCRDLGLAPAIITNGVELDSVPSNTLACCDWIRVSLNTLENTKRPIRVDAIPDGPTVTGCYIYHRGTTKEALREVWTWCDANGISCRVGADTIALSRDAAARAMEEVAELGPPLFPAPHDYSTAESCYMAWWKPCINWDGDLYPCPSIELSPEMERRVPPIFRLCYATEMAVFYARPIEALSAARCSFCKYAAQNRLLDQVLVNVEHRHHV